MTTYDERPQSRRAAREAERGEPVNPFAPSATPSAAPEDTVPRASVDDAAPGSRRAARERDAASGVPAPPPASSPASPPAAWSPGAPEPADEPFEHTMSRRELRALREAQQGTGTPAPSGPAPGPSAPPAGPPAPAAPAASPAPGPSAPQYPQQYAPPAPTAGPPPVPPSWAPPAPTSAPAAPAAAEQPARPATVSAPSTSAPGVDPFAALLAPSSSPEARPALVEPTPSSDAAPPEAPAPPASALQASALQASALQVPAAPAGGAPAAPPAPAAFPEAPAVPAPAPQVRLPDPPPVAPGPTESPVPGSATAAPAEAPQRRVDDRHWSRQAELDDLEQEVETTITRSVRGGHSQHTTSALVIPQDHALMNPVSGTGEVYVTGMIALPDALASTGMHPQHVDQSHLDHLLDPGDEQVASTGSMPVRAASVVNSQTGSSTVIVAPRAQRGNKVLTGLIIAAGVLAVAVVGLVAVLIVTGQL